MRVRHPAPVSRVAVPVDRAQREEQQDRRHTDGDADVVATFLLHRHDSAEGVAGRHHADPRNNRVQDGQRWPIRSDLNRAAEVEDLPQRRERALRELTVRGDGQIVHQVVQKNYRDSESPDRRGGQPD